MLMEEKPRQSFNLLKLLVYLFAFKPQLFLESFRQFTPESLLVFSPYNSCAKLIGLIRMMSAVLSNELQVKWSLEHESLVSRFYKLTIILTSVSRKPLFPGLPCLLIYFIRYLPLSPHVFSEEKNKSDGHVKWMFANPYAYSGHCYGNGLPPPNHFVRVFTKFHPCPLPLK